MSSVKHLSEIANAILDKSIAEGTIEETGKEGIYEFPVDEAYDFFALATESKDIIIGDEEDSAILKDDGDDGSLVGNDENNYLIGNDGDNVIVGMAGHDAITTMGGDDVVIAGDGDDTIIVDGVGTKIIDGGAGDDIFFIVATGEESHTTLKGLTVGDKLRLYADANEDGQIDMKDVDIDKTIEEDGNTTLVLVDGTTVVLEGVVGLFENGAFEMGVDDDGDLFVDITAC